MRQPPHGDASHRIRDAAPEDRPLLVGFMARLQDHERQIEANRRPGSEMAAGHLDYLLGLVAEQDGFVLVAERGRQAVGFLVGIVEQIDAGDLHIVESQRRYGYVSDLFVAPAARGLGLGDALLDEAERRFRAKGLPTMMISYLEANEPARRLYARAGFADYSRTARKLL